MASWKLQLPRSSFNFPYTLGGGQSFRWKEIAENEWVGVLRTTVLSLKQHPDRIECKVLASAGDSSEKTLRDVDDFLRVDSDVEKLYSFWSERDPYFKSIAGRVPGIRLLKQDPVETLFAFICSANNNIPRISSMVSKLCRHYGELIGSVEGEEYYSFPPPQALAGRRVEEELRSMGFGYRAKYIHQTATTLVERGDGWLMELRHSYDYLKAREALITLSGVGPKVADCVCLMSLDKLEAVPVDTHVWQVAKRHYGFSRGGKDTKTVSSKAHIEIGDHFRSIFGESAGWAQTVLFCRELSPVKPQTMAKGKQS